MVRDFFIKIITRSVIGSLRIIVWMYWTIISPPQWTAPLAERRRGALAIQGSEPASGFLSRWGRIELGWRQADFYSR